MAKLLTRASALLAQEPKTVDATGIRMSTATAAIEAQRKRRGPGQPSAASKNPSASETPAPPVVASPPMSLADETMSIIDVVRLNAHEIIERQARGESLKEIGASLPQKPLTGLQIQKAVEHDAELYALWRGVDAYRARYYMEEAGRMAANAAIGGDFKGAGSLFLALAAKTAPQLYGDKTQVELTGKNGGPVESKVTLDPTEAYRRMLEG